MSSDEKKKIEAIIILEVLGRPPEYLVEALNTLIKNISEEKGVTVKKSRITQPTELKDQKNFYTSFAEIEIDIEEILILTLLMFKYMPAHVEVVSPQNLSLPNSGWNEVLNELIRRLHGYEEVARIIQTEKTILENQLRTLAGPKIEEIKEENKEVKIKKPKKK